MSSGRMKAQRIGSVSPIRAVLFDYGHTLVDFRPAEENLLECYEEVRRFLTRRALEDLPEAGVFVSEVARRVSRRIFDSYEAQELQELDPVALFDDALRGLGFELELEVVREIAQMEHRALMSDIAILSENLAVLSDLKELGLKLGLVSNATLLPEMMHADIERLAIARYMDYAVFSSEIGVRKPHPAIYRAVLDALTVEPSAAVLVGDRLQDDIAGAQSVGMLGVLTRQFRQEDAQSTSVNPDFVISKLAEIVDFVKSITEEASAATP